MLEEMYENKIYSNRGNHEVLSLIPQAAQRVLDIGCGAGDNAKELKKMGKYVVGLTISHSEAKIVEQICDRIIVGNIEDTRTTINEQFDCIIMSHICEHLVSPQNVIDKIIDNLSAKGILIIAVPNMAYYKLRMRLLKGNWTLEDSGPFDKTHLHFYSFSTANNIYTGQRLKLLKKIPGQPSIPLWPIRKLMPKICNKFDEKIGNRIPNLFAMQTILIYGKQ
jgi:SAM-dependent methyltransferase